MYIWGVEYNEIVLDSTERSYPAQFGKVGVYFIIFGRTALNQSLNSGK